jgi:hypothetical protein
MHYSLAMANSLDDRIRARVEQFAAEQIEQIQKTHPKLGALRVLAVPSAGALREGLQSLPAHVTCAGDDEVDLAALDKPFDFRDPIAISRRDDPVHESRKVLKSIAHGARQRIGVAAPP